jgi:DNA-directed RNA polymerase subunit RPC12/RpoP
MTISSRTPEGVPHRCPVCGNEARIELSTVRGDAPCPSCGSLLWLKARRQPAQIRRLMIRAAIKAALVGVALIPGLSLGVIVLMGYLSINVLGMGVPEYAVLGIIAVVLFGRRLPEVAKNLGKHVITLRCR